MVKFIKMLRAQKEPVEEFDGCLWGCMVDYVTVGDGGISAVGLAKDGCQNFDTLTAVSLRPSDPPARH